MIKPAQSFQDLIVWQKAHRFVLAIYKITEQFPRHEIYGLTSQIRRASVSIPANIAEGFRKNTAADKARFMNIAQGSLEEVRYYLHHLALTEISKMLHAYRKSILTPDS